MISLLNDMQFGRRFHFGTNGLKESKRAEGIPGPLNEDDRRREVEKHMVSQLCRVSASAKRVSEADEGAHGFLQGDVAPDS